MAILQNIHSAPSLTLNPRRPYIVTEIFIYRTPGAQTTPGSERSIPIHNGVLLPGQLHPIEGQFELIIGP
jgi:hypothetical protein